MIFRPSRRAFLHAIPLSLAAQVKLRRKKAKPLPAAGEFVRIVDPVTENLVIRLTSIKSTSLLPFIRNHFVSSRERLLVFSSNRTGRFTPFQIDLRTGGVRQISEPDALDPRSLCLDRQDKILRYLDAGALVETELSHGSSRKLGDEINAFSLAANGALFLISKGKLSCAEMTDVNAGRVLADGAIDLWPQPNAAGCLFARNAPNDQREFYYVSSTGSEKPVLIASGKIRDPFWDVDGESILFLRDVASPNGTVLAEIHGRSIHGGDEYSVSLTSQFASFAPNSDASVFVGASRSHAQPNVVITLRSPHREMTLCEHRAANPQDVIPVFSPDNRRIYFESDREGRSAIYSVNVELLVEPQLS